MFIFNKSNNLLIFALIIILASFFRLYSLSAAPPGLYPDEAMNGNNALTAAATGDYKVFYPENNGREGLFINIQALFLRFLPAEPSTLRLVSALFGILTVLALYPLTRRLFRHLDRKKTDLISLLAAFFMAVSFWHVNFSRIGFRAIMAPFFIVLALYLFLVSIKNNSDSVQKAEVVSWSSSGHWLLPLIAGAVFGLGFHSYIAYRVLPLLFFVFIFSSTCLVFSFNCSCSCNCFFNFLSFLLCRNCFCMLFIAWSFSLRI